MRAVVYQEPCKVTVEQVEDPRIEQPGDAIVKISTTAICGSDLHMYEGRTAAKPGTVLGHENMGVVEEVGPGVTSIKVGDRVVLPFNIACGFCYNCLRGYPNACLTVNPAAPHAAYGYAQMGPFRGGQADYLRVPYADYNCLKLPGQPGDQWEDDFLLLADIWPTGHHGVVLAGVTTGSTVGIFGAGPVGLMATLSAIMMGAAEVYVIDRVPERLQAAAKLGATPINFMDGDPVEQIKEIRGSNGALKGRLRPGEEKMAGVDHGIDAVGYQARDDEHPQDEENPTQILSDLVRLVNPTGKLGILGVYMAKDPKGVDPEAKVGHLMLPWAEIFEKGLQIGMGQAPVKNYNEFLRDMIIAGRAKPSQIVSHRLPLESAPDAYHAFDQRGGEYTKVLLKPGLPASAA